MRKWGPAIVVMTTLIAGFLVAAEAREVLPEKERKKRLSKLRRAAIDWIGHRRKFPIDCPMCQGRGMMQRNIRRRVRWVKCTQCEGHKKWIPPKHYKAAYYDLRSPDFQKLPGIKDVLTEQYKLAEQGKPWPTPIRRYRWGGHALVDAEHGVAFFLYGAAKVPTETRWIWRPVPGKKNRFRWYLYDARADGPWPTGSEDARAPSEMPADGLWEPLSTAEHGEVREAVVAARISFRSFEYQKRGGTLRVKLKPLDTKDERAPEERIAGDAVRLTRTVLLGTSHWPTVRCDWYVDWCDDFGNTLLKPTWVSSLDRATHEGTVWSELGPEQQVQRLSWQQVRNPGWTLSRVHEAPPPEPEPEPPSPTEPSERTPTQPEPAPPPPVVEPPPPPPEPVAEPEPAEIPELDSTTKRRAQKHMDKMLALYAQAQVAHDEGLEARKNGAHDLWQEKLAEARSIIGEIEETWEKEMVPCMPGTSDIDKDATANHHYGEIWDEVYALKAVVRKLSRAR